MKRSKSPVVTELEYIEPSCTVFESGSTTIISSGAEGERALDGLRHVDLVRPLLRPDRIAVQCVHDGIAAVLVLAVAGGQEDDRRRGRRRRPPDCPPATLPWTLMCSTVTGFAPATTGGISVCTCAKLRPAVANASGIRTANPHKRFGFIVTMSPNRLDPPQSTASPVRGSDRC